MSTPTDPTPEPLKAFKGFKPDLTCRGFQFIEGGTVESDTASLCVSGFHAVTSPLDVFAYYPPGTSIYRLVELEGVDPKREGDSKVSARKLTVGASVNLAGLAKAHVEYVRENIDTKQAQTKLGKTASNTGDRSAASNTGDRSAASNTGYQSAASNTGYQSAASNTGDRSAASNTGDRSAASNTGYQSAASVEGAESVAIVTGYGSKAAGGKDCWIVLTERDDEWKILEVRAVKVGSRPNGVTVKPGVFYTLRGGKVVVAA